MPKTKKTISIERINECARRSTMTTMSIEGRKPPRSPKANTASAETVVANFKSSSRQLIG